jgi:hypothetical protein
MTPHEFIRKWKPVALTERPTTQEHFLDLCRLVGHPTPVEEDPPGTRPSAPNDQRTASAYIFGAICPAAEKAPGLSCPSCNSEAMALNLEEISLVVAPSAHALVLLDQVGWHASKSCRFPAT